MDLVNCTFKRRPIKDCCGEEATMGSDTENNDPNNESIIFAVWKNKSAHRGPISDITATDQCKKEYTNVASAPIRRHSIYEPSELLHETKNPEDTKRIQEELYGCDAESQERNFLCPRCSERMEEPRLLPCLHPMCSPCVAELMNKTLQNRFHSGGEENCSTNRAYNLNETCPVCDSELPNASSPIPPPHYPLQHRLIMNAMRCRLVNRVLCDACSDEVLALLQCSTCLRNFCSDCGMEHEQQVSMELKPTKHSVRPLWEATKVRRTALCQRHPTHALRFYCIACQQVTCKECMWSIQHRGHASENAAGAGKRTIIYLTALLERAKLHLNGLLTQYNYNVFSSNVQDGQPGAFVSSSNQYVSLHS